MIGTDEDAEKKDSSSCRIQKALETLSHARTKPVVTRSCADFSKHPDIHAPKRSPTPCCRQWYYNIHRYFQWHEDAPPKEEKGSETVQRCHLQLVRHVLSTLVSSITLCCCSVLFEITWSEITFLTPKIYQILCGILLGCSIVEFPCPQQEPSRGTFLPYMSSDCWESFEGYRRSPTQIEVGDHFVESCKDITAKSVDADADSRFIESIKNNRKAIVLPIEKILESEMRMASCWKDMPYLCTTRVLKALDEISFTSNNLSQMAGYYLHQQLQPIIVLFREEDIKERVKARMRYNLTVVSCMFDTLIGEGKMATETWLNPPDNLSCGYSAGGATVERKKEEHSSKSSSYYESSKSTMEESSCVSHHLGSGYIVFPDLHQTESFLQFICENNPISSVHKRLLEAKSYILRGIGDADTTALDGSG